jgi:hypothetical protein
MNLPPWTQVAVANLTTFGLKLLGSIAVWIIGRRLIALAVRMVMAAVPRQSIDDFDTNRAIRETFAAAGYPAPEQLVYMRSGTTG